MFSNTSSQLPNPPPSNTTSLPPTAPTPSAASASSSAPLHPPPPPSNLPPNTTPWSVFQLASSVHPSKSQPKAVEDLRLHLAELTRTTEGERLLAGVLPGQGGQPLNPLFDFEWDVYGLGGLYYLTAQLQAINFTQMYPQYLDGLYFRARDFITKADFRQFQKLEAPRINLLARYFLALAKHLNYVKYAVDLLLKLLVRWQDSSRPDGSLTGVHSHFVEACILSHQYEYALYVIDVPITEIDKSFYHLTYLDHIRYHFLAGVVFAALKQWDDAAEMFEITVTAPALSCSAIQIAAYKKLVLVQLIKDGKTTPLPKYVSACVTRAIKHHCSVYKTLADAFDNHRKPFKPVSSSDREIFSKDKNNGLLDQILATRLSRQIINLTKTYSSLTFSDLASLLKLEQSPESEDLLKTEIHRMIATSQISATIASSSSATSPTSTTISFHPPTSTLPLPPVLIPQLDALTQHAAHQASLLWNKDRDVAKSEKYLVKAAKEEREFAASGGAGGGMGGMGMGGDEDLMMDFGAGGGGGGAGAVVGLGGRKTYDDDF